MLKRIPPQLIVLILLIGLLVACGGGAEPTAEPEAQTLTLRVATTTSTENSGLLAHLLPDFEEQYHAEVDVVAVGTGQALQLGMDGNADVLLVHARAREDTFMAEGHGSRREDVMYNDFVIIGPAGDPAGIQGEPDAAQAFQMLSEAQATFVSRGDDSGTHTKEKALWEAAGIEPAGDWYVSAGQGMGAVLTMADEQQAYTLSDRATYLARTLEGIELEILVEGDPILFNPYGVIAVNPEKGEHIQAELANGFIDWLISVGTQEKIAEFGVAEFETPLFTPDSAAWRQAHPPVETTTTGEVVLELVGLNGSKTLTMDELKALPATESWGGSKSSTGRITVPSLYKGVALADLCALVGGLDPSTGVSVVADDGYAMTISYEQLTNGDFIAYDPATGDEIDPGEPLTAVVAYEIEGEPLPEKSDGTLRLVILGSDNRQVTDGHWWVKWVNSIEIKSLGEEWTLALEGAISEEMDRGTFESCAAPGCHGSFWTDGEGQEWQGVPLYLIAGRVDDENKHDFGGFNVELADAGYTIEVVAADGYSVILESGATVSNDNIIVAFQMDDEQLPEKYWPLRLVGSELEKSDMVGQIAQIKVIFQPVASEGETTEALPQAPEGEAALTVSGLVEQELSLAMETLQGMEVVQITAEHPRKGTQDEYTGLLLSDLLAYAAPTADASSVVLTAVDGYSSELSLADLQGCADCLVAFNDFGGLKTVMPGMDGMTWVKDLVSIEVK